MDLILWSEFWGAPHRKPSSQIKGARKILNESYDEHSKLYPDHTIGNKRSPRTAIKLLRALDAALVGVHNHIIGEKIFPSKTWILPKNKSAEDKDYEKKIAIGQERVATAAKYWRVM